MLRWSSCWPAHLCRYRSENALVYWRINKDHFPALARAYLSAPCTSVESERLFSLAGNVIDERRNRVSGDKAEMLLFVKKILPLMLKSHYAYTYAGNIYYPITELLLFGGVLYTSGLFIHRIF